ncbi:MAG TPA: MarR family transcriptional regulator [Thermotogota bacterium]|nr:MarR family transcriptional regulator [Thermotogota bacterium]HRW92753.1 MarR family transcriptional regulator [Thermotogota bacterium]
MRSRNFQRLLSCLAHDRGRVLSLSARSLNLGTSHLGILVWLSHEEKGINQEKLGESIGLDKTTIARHVKKLVQMGLVFRRVNPLDHREKILTLTEKGREMVPEIKRMADRWFEGLARNIHPSELEIVERTLEKMVENIES